MGATVSISRSDVRAWLRSAVHGNPWRYERLEAPVPIGPLVSPLRYDILIRRDYFMWFAERLDSYARDFAGYARAAREHPYFTWFREVMCPTWQPEVLADERTFEAAWHRRLRSAAALHQSYARRGFDERFPITLYAGVRVLPSPTGTRTARTLFAGDGNHRLALLLADGATELRPEHCRVQRFLTLAPADTTALLAPALGLSPSEHAEFLALGAQEAA